MHTMCLDYIHPSVPPPNSPSPHNTSHFQLPIFFLLKNNRWVQLVLTICTWMYAYPPGHGDPSRPPPKKSDSPTQQPSAANGLALSFVLELARETISQESPWAGLGEKGAPYYRLGGKLGSFLSSPQKCKALERWTCLKILKAWVP